MNLYPRNYTGKENSENVGNALLKLIESNLHIKQYGFQISFKNFENLSSITAIYNSEWCRLSFTFSFMRFPQADELSIEYGRLHASNEKPFMIWRGEECHCWHNVLIPIRFLDGLTPTEAYKQVMVDKKLPDVIRNYQESKLGKELMNEYPPKNAIVIQEVIWKHYGKKLFELFDLRHPDLWEEYSRFIREYYGLMSIKSIYGPPYEKVC